MIKYTIYPDGLLTPEGQIQEFINQEVKHYKINISQPASLTNRVYQMSRHRRSIFNGVLPLHGSCDWGQYVAVLIERINAKRNLPILGEIGT